MFTAWVFGHLLFMGGLHMTYQDTNESFRSLGTCLEDIQLKVYYTTNRTTHAVENGSYRFIQKSELKEGVEISELFEHDRDAQSIPLENPDEFFLAVRLGGRISSIDEVSLRQCDIKNEEINVLLEMIRVESADLEPFPVAAFVLLPLNRTITMKARLTIELNGFNRSFEGKLTPMQQAPAKSLSIDFRQVH